VHHRAASTGHRVTNKQYFHGYENSNFLRREGTPDMK
jgi:hypothetical protein